MNKSSSSREIQFLTVDVKKQQFYCRFEMNSNTEYNILCSLHLVKAICKRLDIKYYVFQENTDPNKYIFVLDTDLRFNNLGFLMFSSPVGLIVFYKMSDSIKSLLDLYHDQIHISSLFAHKGISILNDKYSDLLEGEFTATMWLQDRVKIYFHFSKKGLNVKKKFDLVKLSNGVRRTANLFRGVKHVLSSF